MDYMIATIFGMLGGVIGGIVTILVFVFGQRERRQ